MANFSNGISENIVSLFEYKKKYGLFGIVGWILYLALRENSLKPLRLPLRFPVVLAKIDRPPKFSHGLYGGGQVAVIIPVFLQVPRYRWVASAT